METIENTAAVEDEVKVIFQESGHHVRTFKIKFIFISLNSTFIILFIHLSFLFRESIRYRGWLENNGVQGSTKKEGKHYEMLERNNLKPNSKEFQYKSTSKKKKGFRPNTVLVLEKDNGDLTVNET